jgi:DNA primase
VTSDVEAVKEQVRIYTVLADYHVEFYGGGVPEQIHCPFHYPDTNRSCRVYPENDSLYCFVCDKTWDVIEFVKDKEELTFGKAVFFLKSRYGVEVYTPDYVTQLDRNRRQAQTDVLEMADSVERMFRETAYRLTDGNLYPILEQYNKCWAVKDDLQLTGAYSVEDMVDWYETSVRLLRLELGNGQETHSTT